MAGSHLLLVSRLRMSGAIPLVPCVLHGLVRDNFNFTFTFTYARKILVHQYGTYHLLILRSDVVEEHVLCIQLKVDGTVKR
jgi:hypothetical protein